MKKKNLAFTLAEVLIVIGIIGVVAALTLPNLNKATGNKETITKVKKAYSTLTEAFDRAQAIYGDYDTWDEHNCSTNECKLKRISEFMKVSKDCITDNVTNCWYNSGGTLYNHRGQAFSGTSIPSAFVTADGMSVALGDTIYVDIDGPKKGPSLFGKDLFSLSIVNNQLSYASYDPTLQKVTCEFNAFMLGDLYNSGHFYTCWIMEYDNMDYLKFTDANGTCDNGNVVTESNPS